MPKTSAPVSQLSRRKRYDVLKALRKVANLRLRNGDDEDIPNREDMQGIGEEGHNEHHIQENDHNNPPQQVDLHQNVPEAEGDEEEAQSEATDNSSEADSADESIGNADGVNGESDEEGNIADSENEDEDVENEDEDVDNDDDESDDGYDELDNFGNRPLYAGAPVTVRESAALVFTLMLSHGLSHSCVSDLLTIIHLHCRSEGLVKLSLYKLKKYFSFCSGKVNKKYYCSECCRSLATPQEVCGVCCRRKSVSYFIQMPLVPQLKKVFARPNFYHDLQHRFNRGQGTPGFLRDIYDGRLYREHVKGFLDNPRHFTMTYFTDGVPVFKSKNYSFWGFHLTINELPYKQRVQRQNTLMAGLWFGPKKPNANLFMNSFIDDFREIYKGFNVFVGNRLRRIFVRGIVLCGVADSPARSTFMNIVHHNGFYGCPCCEIVGETVLLPRGSNTHVYRYEQGLQKRTPDRMFQHARQAFDGNAPVMGVKGPSSLRLFVPDFVRGTAIDTMHLLLGIVRKFIMLLFDSKYAAEGFSLRAVVGIADDQLLAIQPPKYINGLPRSLADICHWKASEIKAWFFYYSVPILQEFMKPIYFDHYLTLVIAISYLNASSVSLAMIDKAEDLLHEFVQGFQNLYGLQFCSINIHMLLHLPDCVRELGPTWVYSCFPYKNINGEILRTIHGKTDVSSQVSSTHWFCLDLQSKLHFLVNGPVKDFCLRQSKRLMIGERLFPSCYVVGQYTNREANNLLITQCLQRSNIIFTKVKIYFRLLKDSILYVSEKYSRNEKWDSSYVAINEEQNRTLYGRVYAFVKALRCDCNMACDCVGEHLAIVKLTEKVSEYTALHHPNTALIYMHRFRMTLNVSAIPVKNLKCVCLHLVINNERQYIAEPVNDQEVE